jgi:hypothetical protein
MEFRVGRWVEIDDPGARYHGLRGQIKELAGDHMILELFGQSGRLAFPLKQLKIVCGGRVPFKSMPGSAPCVLDAGHDDPCKALFAGQDLAMLDL